MPTDLVPAQLLLGGVDLSGQDFPDGDYKTELLAEGTGWGNPEQAVAEVVSALLDGSIGKVTSHGNRTVTARVLISAPDGDSLAVGEAALVAAIPDGTWRSALSWQSPAEFAAPTVWDVIYGRLDFVSDDGWDMDEKRRRRTYLLTLECFPWARPQDQILVSALPLPLEEGGDPVADLLVDDCSVIGSWEPWSTNTVMTLVPEGVRGTREDSQTAGIRRTALIAADPLRPFLRINGRALFNYTDTAGAKTPGSVNFTINGDADASPASYSYDRATGDFSVVFYVPDGVTSTLYAQAIGARDNHNDWAVIQVNDVTLVGSSGYSGTNRQQARNIPVYGSVRTEAMIEVRGLDAADAPVPLGSRVLVYTAPVGVGFVSPLRAHRLSGQSITPDTALVSGAYSTLGAVVETWAVGADETAAGSYQLIVRLRCASASTQALTVTATTTVDDDATLGDSITVTQSRSVTFASASTWDFYQVAALELPTTEVDPATAATVTITLAAANAGVVDIDEAWLVRMDDGCAVSLVDTSGAGVSMLRVAPAAAGRPRPSYWVGHADDDTHLISATSRVRWWGQHLFAPGEVTVFVVTTASTVTQTALRYYPRFHTHVYAISSPDVEWIAGDST